MFGAKNPFSIHFLIKSSELFLCSSCLLRKKALTSSYFFSSSMKSGLNESSSANFILKKVMTICNVVHAYSFYALLLKHGHCRTQDSEFQFFFVLWNCIFVAFIHSCIFNTYDEIAYFCNPSLRHNIKYTWKTFL